MASLNIKNPEVCRLIEELAAATGETMTGAVKTAVRERLERVRERNSVASLAERLMEIGRDCARRLGPEFRSIDPDTLLYDERGLPR